MPDFPGPLIVEGTVFLLDDCSGTEIRDFKRKRSDMLNAWRVGSDQQGNLNPVKQFVEFSRQMRKHGVSKTIEADIDLKTITGIMCPGGFCAIIMYLATTYSVHDGICPLPASQTPDVPRPHSGSGSGVRTANNLLVFNPIPRMVLDHHMSRLRENKQSEPTMSTFTDDKAPICIPFITQLLQTHQASSPNRPLIIGLNGLQGVGKTTLVAPLAAALETRNIHTLVFSIDDFYLPHDKQVSLAALHPENALVQHRGEPGTHDIPLAKSVFASLMSNTPTFIPQYDKALFSGQGDRLPARQWMPVNHAGQTPIQVVIFEGWCVGFRPISAVELETRWKSPSRTLQKHRLEHLRFVNEELRNYDALTDCFDAFIHIDSEDAEYVYAWRQEQEDWLRVTRGDPTAGMTPEQVVRFVDGYYPAYELYTDGVRRGIFKDRSGYQLRIIVGKDRKVKEVVRI